MLIDDNIKETVISANSIHFFVGDGIILLSLYTGNHRAKPSYVMVYSKELYLQALMLKGWLSLSEEFDVKMTPLWLS